jgi:hypothetical protein
VGRGTDERLAALNPDVPFVLIPRARATPELELPAHTTAAIDRLIHRLESALGQLPAE